MEASWEGQEDSDIMCQLIYSHNRYSEEAVQDNMAPAAHETREDYVDKYYVKRITCFKDIYAIYVPYINRPIMMRGESNGTNRIAQTPLSYPWPLVSVIISNYNSKYLLKRCLKCLLKSNYPRFEVIVVDAGSSDGSAEMVTTDFPHVKLIRAGRIGLCEAINIGINISQGDYLSLELNSDDFVDENWMIELVKALRSSEDIGMVTGKRLMDHSKDTIYSAGSKLSWLTGETSRIGYKQRNGYNMKRVIEIANASCLVKRDVIRKVGAYDIDYFLYYEDTDYSVRVRRAGYKILYVPTALYSTIGAATIGRYSLRGYFYKRRNQIRFIVKNSPFRYMIPGILWTLIFKTFIETFFSLPPIQRLLILIFTGEKKAYIKFLGQPECLIMRLHALAWALRDLRSAVKARMSQRG